MQLKSVRGDVTDKFFSIMSESISTHMVEGVHIIIPPNTGKCLFMLEKYFVETRDGTTLQRDKE